VSAITKIIRTGRKEMGEKRHEKLIMTDFNAERDEIGTLLFRLDADKVADIPLFTGAAWVWPKPTEIVMEGESHSHEFDEIVTLFGTNPEDPRDLCGEVEFWLEDEKYKITRSCMIYIPKGLRHCPMIFRKVERPIFHYVVGQGSRYTR
jgi:hypothetical protein